MIPILNWHGDETDPSRFLRRSYKLMLSRVASIIRYLDGANPALIDSLKLNCVVFNAHRLFKMKTFYVFCKCKD